MRAGGQAGRAGRAGGRAANVQLSRGLPQVMHHLIGLREHTDFEQMRGFDVVTSEHTELAHKMQKKTGV